MAKKKDKAMKKARKQAAIEAKNQQ